MGYLLPLLKPGGVYIIEDIHTSLQPRYDQPRLGNKTTLMMVERWQSGLPIRSPFMSAEQQVQLGREPHSLLHPLTCGRSPYCICCIRLRVYTASCLRQSDNTCMHTAHMVPHMHHPLPCTYQAYVNAWLVGCLRVVPPNSRSTLSQTCVCWKREKPRVRAVQEVKASPRASMLSRLYDDDEAIMSAGAAKALPKADHGCRSERKVPRVFQGR